MRGVGKKEKGEEGAGRGEEGKESRRSKGVLTEKLRQKL